MRGSFTILSRVSCPVQAGVRVWIVPPARAEELYAPETFGRCGTDRVVVEP